MADVFISYAREDQAFARALADSLKDRGKEVWADWKDIPSAVNWKEEARTWIEASDSIVFVMTRHSVGSENCLFELGHAEAHSKRIIPVRKDPLEAEDLPQSVALLNWIDFTKVDVASGSAAVVEAADRDLEWVRGHTRWLRDAIEWDEAEREQSHLLRGVELADAEAWLTQAQAQAREPPASPLHYEYILAGRRLATGRQRRLFITVTVALALAIGLALTAYSQRNEAVEQRRVAVSQLLASEALAEMDERLDRGLLLSAAAYEVEPTPEARSSVLRGLRRSERILGFLRPKGGGPVSAVSFDPVSGGRTLASGSDDGRVRIWNVGRRAAQPYGGHLDAVKGVVYSGDGRLLASVDVGETMLLRTAANPGRTSEPLPGADVTAVAFAPRGALLAVGTKRGAIALWDPERGTLFRKRLEGAPISALSFGGDGTRLAAASPRGLLLLRLRDGRPHGQPLLFGRGAAVVDVAFAESGRRLAAVRADGRVIVWTLAAKRPTARPLVDAPGSSVSAAVGKAEDLATGAADGSITVWDRAWASQVARLRGHGKVVADLAFDAAGATVASASRDGTLVLWAVGGTPFHERIPVEARVDGPLEPVYDMAFTPESGLLIASALGASGYGRVVVAPATGGQASDLGRGPGTEIDLDLAPDGSRFAAAGRGGAALWRLGDEPEREELSGPGGAPATAVAFSSDSKTLAVGLREGAIRLWPLAGREKPRVLRTADETVEALAFSPDRPLLASGAKSGALTVWHVVDEKQTPLPERLPDSVRSVAFSPDRRLLAFGGGTTVVVWNVASWTPYARLTPPLAAVTDVAFSPRDGRWLAMSDDAGRIVFWDVRERRSVGEPIDSSEGGIEVLAFRPDGSGLVAGTSSGALLLWDDIVWSADEARNRICRLVDRELSKEERAEFLPSGTDVEPCAETADG